MDVEQVVAIVVRRWKLVLAVLLVAAVGAVQVRSLVSSEFEVRGSMILLSPPVIPSTTGGDMEVNPWSRFGGAESGAAAALIQVLQSDSTSEAVLKRPGVTSFVVGTNRSNGAIIDLTVRASNVDAAVSTYDLAVELLTSELEQRQEQSGAPPPTWLRADELTSPETARELPGSKLRASLAVAALGAVTAVYLAVAADTLSSRRRRARATGHDADDADDVRDGEAPVDVAPEDEPRADGHPEENGDTADASPVAHLPIRTRRRTS